MNDHLLLDLAERVRGRAFGKYRGTVTEVDADTLRLKAKVPAVLHETTSGWCWPCVPYAGDGVGFAFLPEVGAGVWIEFEGGDTSYPIWTGCYWRAGEVPPDATPTVKAIVTAGGSKILLDDDNGVITIEDGNKNKLTIDSSGITLERGSNKVVVSDSSVKVNDSGLEIT
jgi:uncharacterized protein involved in type VI secretion and phage assembly